MKRGFGGPKISFKDAMRRMQSVKDSRRSSTLDTEHDDVKHDNIICEQLSRLLSIPAPERTEREQEELVAWSVMLPFFNQLSRRAVGDIIANTKYKRIAKKSIITREGASGNTLFVLIGGEMSVYRHQSGKEPVHDSSHGNLTYRDTAKAVMLREVAADEESHLDVGTKIASVTAPDAVGELALIREKDKRKATIIANEGAEILLISRSHYMACCRKYGNVLFMPKRFLEILESPVGCHSLEDTTLVSDILRTLRFFQSLPEKATRTLAGKVQIVTHGKNQRIYQKGDPVDALYVVLQGTAYCYNPSERLKRETAQKSGELTEAQLALISTELESAADQSDHTDQGNPEALLRFQRSGRAVANAEKFIRSAGAGGHLAIDLKEPARENPNSPPKSGPNSPCKPTPDALKRRRGSVNTGILQQLREKRGSIVPMTSEYQKTNVMSESPTLPNIYSPQAVRAAVIARMMENSKPKKKRVFLNMQNSGDIFGERCLIDVNLGQNDEGQVRPDSAISGAEGCLLLVLSKEVYMETPPELRENVAKLAQQVLLRKLLMIPPQERVKEDASSIMQLTSSSKFLSSLDSKLVLRLCTFATYMKIEEDEPVFLQGDAADNFYVIISGTCSVNVLPAVDVPAMHRQLARLTRENGTKCVDPEEVKGIIGMRMAEMSSGASFGELALIQGGMRNATIWATSVVECMVIDRASYENCLADVQAHVLRKKVSMLRNIGPLHSWSTARLAKLAYYFNATEFERGSTVIQQGDMGSNVCLIKDAEVTVIQRVSVESNDFLHCPTGHKSIDRSKIRLHRTQSEDDLKHTAEVDLGKATLALRATPIRGRKGAVSKDACLAIMGAGHHFGEYAILTQCPQPFSVVTSSKGEIYVANGKELFQKMVEASEQSSLDKIRESSVEMFEHLQSRADTIISSWGMISTMNKGKVGEGYFPPVTETLQAADSSALAVSSNASTAKCQSEPRLPPSLQRKRAMLLQQSPLPAAPSTPEAAYSGSLTPVSTPQAPYAPRTAPTETSSLMTPEALSVWPSWPASMGSRQQGASKHDSAQLMKQTSNTSVPVQALVGKPNGVLNGRPSNLYNRAMFAMASGSSGKAGHTSPSRAETLTPQTLTYGEDALGNSWDPRFAFSPGSASTLGPLRKERSADCLDHRPIVLMNSERQNETAQIHRMRSASAEGLVAGNAPRVSQSNSPGEIVHINHFWRDYESSHLDQSGLTAAVSSNPSVLSQQPTINLNKLTIKKHLQGPPKIIIRPRNPNTGPKRPQPTRTAHGREGSDPVPLVTLG